MNFDRKFRPYDKRALFPFCSGTCDACKQRILRGSVVIMIHHDIFDYPRLYLNCPFKEKDQAKNLGATWDPKRKRWYVDEWTDTSVQDFARWLSSPHDSFTTWYPSYYHEQCAEKTGEDTKSLMHKAYLNPRKRQTEDAAALQSTKRQRLVTRRRLSDVEKDALRLRLREERERLSEIFKKVTFMIFPNAALEDLLEKLPRTHDELIRVKGIKHYRSAMYGDDILHTIRDFFAELHSIDDNSEMVVDRPVALTSRISPRLSEREKAELRYDLKTVRDYLAYKHQTSKYLVFTNESLEDLVNKLPSCRNELLQIRGIKSFIANRYSNLILAVINSFVESIKYQKSTADNDFNPIKVHPSSARMVSP